MASKAIAIGLLAAGMTLGLAGPGFAQKSHGMAHKAIGSVAPKGATGEAHRELNQTRNTAPDVTGTVPGSQRSVNSTRGGTAAKTGVPGANGTLHSGANKALKPLR